MRAQESSAWYLPVADVAMPPVKMHALSALLCGILCDSAVLNFKSPKIQQIINAEDAEDFAKARRGLGGKSFITVFAVSDALGCVNTAQSKSSLDSGRNIALGRRRLRQSDLNRSFVSNKAQSMTTFSREPVYQAARFFVGHAGSFTTAFADHRPFFGFELTCHRLSTMLALPGVTGP